MHEKEWMRVADLLCQIRSKYEKVEIQYKHHLDCMADALEKIEHLLQLNEIMADAAFTGWL